MKNPPSTIGRYEVVECEGLGDDVFEGRRDKSRFLLALYDLHQREATELEHEIARTASISHPQIVPAVEAFDHESYKVLVFEHVDGITLRQMFIEGAGERPDDGAAFFIAHALFAALAAAHTARNEQGEMAPLVHGRLSPAQLFVSWDGEVKLLGFGLSILHRMASATAGGKPDDPYAPPEVRSGGALTVRGNVYSAALMVWALLTGTEPDHKPAPLETLRPDLPESITEAVNLALETSLLKRHIMAAQLAETFEPLAADGAAKLRWHLEPMRAIVNFDDMLLLRDSLPPPGISDVPAASMPPLVTIPPHSNSFDDLFAAPRFDAGDLDDTAVTIPAPPKKRPPPPPKRRLPPPPKKKK